MKKKVFLLLLVLLLTGCKTKYNLQINFGGNFIESGSIYLDTSLLGLADYPKDNDAFLEYLAEKYNGLNYRTKLPFKEGAYLGYNFYHRYHNGITYSNQSPIFKVIFNGISYKENDHYVILKTNGDNKLASFHNPSADIKTRVEVVEVNISLPYRVVKHNASKVDADTNTYTWLFYPNDAKPINLEYRNNELYTNNPAFLLKFISPYIYITIFLTIVGLIIVSIIASRMRIMNRL